MSKRFAITGASIDVDEQSQAELALIVEGKHITDVISVTTLPSNLKRVSLSGGMLLPGFIDLQVNGGGGVLFNNEPSVDAIKTICAAHTKLGTCQLLVTLISSSAQTTRLAIQSAITAANQDIPGFLGLHLEGPHLAVAKKGAHSACWLRSMSDADVNELCSAKSLLPHLMVTLAPEIVSAEQISQLTTAGIIVSLGHSNASYAESMNAYEQGARCATHLFNAMSGLNHREPGLVGATLMHDDAYTGLIADGVHVHASAIKTALRTKNEANKGCGKVFLVSDAMATAGTDMTEFSLDERTIFRKQGHLQLADGTLAGADTDMLSSIRYLTNTVGIDNKDAVRMASQYPSECIGAEHHLGLLLPGYQANIVYLNTQDQLQQVWVDGDAQLN